MADSKSHIAVFEAELLQKLKDPFTDDILLSFRASNTEQSIIARNRLLAERLETGVVYRLKGHQSMLGGHTMLRLISAKPVEQAAPYQTFRRSMTAGSVTAFVLLAIVATAAFTSTATQLSDDNARSELEVVDKAIRGQGQGNFYNGHQGASFEHSRGVLLQNTGSTEVGTPLETSATTSTIQETAAPSGELTQPSATVSGSSDDPVSDSTSPDSTEPETTTPTAAPAQSDQTAMPVETPTSSTAGQPAS